MKHQSRPRRFFVSSMEKIPFSRIFLDVRTVVARHSWRLQRFPADFRGIVTGAPASSWTHLMFRGEQNERAMLDTLASYIPPGKLALLQDAALAKCDALDGVKDGLIQNPRTPPPLLA